MARFDDGMLDIYKKIPMKRAGGKPYEVLEAYGREYYGELGITVSEYYQAKQAGAKVSRRVRIRQDLKVRPVNYAVVIDGEQYDVGRCWHGIDGGVPVSELTLEDVAMTYEFA
jgi:hypothetical protein